MQHYILHYGEIALKNKNRSFFENALQRRVALRCREIAPLTLHKLPGRFWMEFAVTPNAQVVQNKLSKIFGLANFMPCERAEASLENLKENLDRSLITQKFSTFAVRAKRAEKNFPVGSQYVNEEIGRFIQLKTNARVNLDQPETTVHIELFQNHIFYSFEKIPGLGGLPVGVSGKVAVLLSGGIDSPVAAWRMMKRGCEALFIHFHSAPFASAQSEDKALELAEMLANYQDGGSLLCVPFGEIQRQIVSKAPEDYRVLLYRRMMLRIAENLAIKNGCQALVTGEALSQVASQTLSNLSAIESVSNLPVFRPLIGMDKLEIIEQARKIGTFDISIKPHEDCCSLMLPKHPKTRSTKEGLDRVELRLEIDSLVKKGVEEVKTYELTYSKG
ncbi:MAG: tRNA 4-thiouridine(8) synthase ThiI [Deltaproteobacteria bacterium RIFCSPLOWO2_01_44_7]|nr:MAG: tRNA 4-thiouridine(8) synthase ThiI [Deltaproteobacteria bacterium RIFCSPHIGHO2_01_FULL_43_49]OGQ15101.1 MAG: tRNA 4-thiouridine(8) synthase ThiI [Deltaproteobacteria bacterium RIFCSPHIGHO2_02_FULL_44_53]OGQ27279.1 MAG: tRNA 4-thiouridine(8) synthase ThiI [Deltaproteobacteria bacterium RIFCSPHIGHO2_12_FULL_44_21]OGQ31618.1 MAG: tRNA 4-thiouridine(8) synthase ThiI [Deltaproteobacteria bacterium RIFCSPLOWO2_01_FULL_45_74]OGQ41502.1 MAG: tRNA 4-thiouridine(8) synthase ThiI [Deltaproteobact